MNSGDCTKTLGLIIIDNIFIGLTNSLVVGVQEFKVGTCASLRISLMLSFLNTTWEGKSIAFALITTEKTRKQVYTQQ